MSDDVFVCSCGGVGTVFEDCYGLHCSCCRMFFPIGKED